jgi:hypothetical protein
LRDLQVGRCARAGAISVFAHAITLGEFARKRSRYSLRRPSLLRRSFSRDSALLLPLSLECQLLFAIMLAHFLIDIHGRDYILLIRCPRGPRRLRCVYSYFQRKWARRIISLLLQKNTRPWRRSIARRLSARPTKQAILNCGPLQYSGALSGWIQFGTEGLGPMRTGPYS